MHMKTLRSSQVAASAFSARSTFRRVAPPSTQCAAPVPDPKLTILDGRAVVTQPGVVNILPRRCHVSAGAPRSRCRCCKARTFGCKCRQRSERTARDAAPQRMGGAHGVPLGAAGPLASLVAAGQSSCFIMDASTHAAAWYSLVKRAEGLACTLHGCDGCQDGGGGMTLY